MLLKLSGLLSYILYDCNAAAVSLEKELGLLKDYIALQRERYGDNLEISLNLSGDIAGKEIAPLLFLPFVENAFKHGTSEQLETAWISLDLSVKAFWMDMKLVNSRPSYAPSIRTEGIGISNVRKRLDLIYPGDYRLSYGDQNDVFFVALRLKLQ